MPYKEDGGTWRATKMINGKRKTKRFNSKTEAKKWESAQTEHKWIRNEIDNGETTLKDWSKAYIKYAKEHFSPKVALEKETVFRHLFDMIPRNTPVEALTPLMAQKFLRRQAKERTGKAANKDRKNLMAGWTWGVKYLSLPAADPFRAAGLRREEDSKPKYVPPFEDVEKVILAAHDEQTRVFITAMLHTAARRSELCRLTWDDVNFEKSIIRLGTRKRRGGKLEYNWIEMTSVLRSELLKISRSHSKTNHVFVNPTTDEPYKWRQHLMKNLCRRAKVKPFGFHAIRHFTASLMAQRGVPLQDIQGVPRHKSPTTTDRYIHRLGGFGRSVLEGIFEKNKPGTGQDG